MANTRMIRKGLIDSDRFNSLSWAEQAFFTRVLLEADDFGLFDARPNMLLARLFPTKIGEVSLDEISAMAEACGKAGLITFYTSNGKPYGLINGYGQTAKSAPRYPVPEGWCVEEKISGKSKTFYLVFVENGQPDADRCEATRSDAEFFGTKTSPKTPTRSESIRRLAEAEAEAEAEDVVVVEAEPSACAHEAGGLGEGRRRASSFSYPTEAGQVLSALIGSVEMASLSSEQRRLAAESFVEEMTRCEWVGRDGRKVKSWRKMAKSYFASWKRNDNGRDGSGNTNGGVKGEYA